METNKDSVKTDSERAEGNETRTVGLVYSNSHMKTCDTMPRIEGRCPLVHGLIQAYGLRKKLVLIPPRKASLKEMCQFHCRSYLEAMRDREDEGVEDDDAGDDMFGLDYDCPSFEGMYEFVEAVAGGTLAAVDALCRKSCSVACHWEGGWHHGHRDQASGFCYVNDIVLAILKLRDAGHQRVLYVDLDVHHGDGVQGAFSRSCDVMTVSFHRHSPGFFPGTGSMDDCGDGKGKFYSLNVPLGDGTRDETFVRVFSRIMAEVQDRFQPTAVVCQCGADCMAGDPLGAFNLTPAALCQCLQHLLSWNIPLLILGGGGYDFANTARCWLQLTAALVTENLPEEIPEHPNFAKFGPDFTVHVTPGNRREENSEKDVDKLICAAISHLSNISLPN